MPNIESKNKPGRLASRSMPKGMVIDKHIGTRIRMRRVMLGMTQDDLAQAMGITFQQIQKYETARNKLSSARLWEISHLMGVSVDFFFEDLYQILAKNNINLHAVKMLAESEDGQTQQISLNIPEDLFHRNDVLSLIHFYAQIDDETVRKSVVDLARSLSQAPLSRRGRPRKIQKK